MDPWGGQHQCQCPLELLISSYEFKAALAKENREVKRDIELVDKLIIQANLCQKLLLLQNMGRTCCVHEFF